MQTKIFKKLVNFDLFQSFFVLILFLSFFFLWEKSLKAADNFVFSYGIINVEKLNIRKSPSIDAPILGILEKGSYVKILNNKNNKLKWLNISHKDIKGYVRNRSNYVTLTKIQNSVAEKNKHKKKIDKQTRKIQKKIQSFTQKETMIIEALNVLDFELNELKTDILLTKKEIKKLNTAIFDISIKRKKIDNNISQNKKYIYARLNALYKIKMIGRLALCPMPDSAFDFFLQQNSLKKILASDFNMLTKQMNDIKNLSLITNKLGEKRKAKLEFDTRIKNQIRLLEKKTQKRKAILKDIKNKKNLISYSIIFLKQASKMLDKEIKALKADESFNKKGAFSKLYGLLEMPVKGSIISKFGTRQNSNYNSFTFQSGIDIKVQKGAPVRAVFKGKLLYANWLKGYGNLMILNHGDNYYTLYAHVEKILKNKGDFVNTGEIIATAGDTGSIKGFCLYFEIRHHGKPVNPIKWFKNITL